MIGLHHGGARSTVAAGLARYYDAIAKVCARWARSRGAAARGRTQASRREFVHGLTVGGGLGSEEGQGEPSSRHWFGKGCALCVSKRRGEGIYARIAIVSWRAGARGSYSNISSDGNEFQGERSSGSTVSGGRALGMLILCGTGGWVGGISWELWTN